MELGRLDAETTANVGVIQGGSATNVIPASCRIDCEARSLDDAKAAVAVAALVELSRLAHAPALDAFRLTAAGALLLGRVFSPWNLLCYAAGIAAAWAWDRGDPRVT